MAWPGTADAAGRCSAARCSAARGALLAIALLAVAFTPAAAGAQSGAARAPAAASPYLPLDAAAYGYIDALMARGFLRLLPALDRPYTIAAIRAAIADADRPTAHPAERRWIASLEVALDRIDPPGDSARVVAGLAALGTAETSGRRELMRADETSGFRPGVEGRGVLTAGPVVAAVRHRLDQRLRTDPDFRGSTRRAVAGRTEDAYVAARWRWATAFFGRQRRNWGPWGHEGLLLGSYADSWDHAALGVGGRHVWLDLLVARLDPYAAGEDSGRYERHLSVHRLRLRRGGLDVALTESVVYGGVGRGAEFAYLNPLTLYQLSQYNETRDGNVSYALDVAWRSARRGMVAAQLLVDDVQIDRCAAACAEPPSYGFTVELAGLPLVGVPRAAMHRAFVAYTHVSNLAYRPLQPWERYTTFDVGLGRGFSDYDELRAGVDLAIGALPPLRAYAATRRQGEGDYRLPFPPLDSLGAVPAFLSGDVTRTTRLAVSGAWVPRRALAVTLDAGWNVVRPAGGGAQGRLEGRVRGTLDVGSVTFAP